MREIKFRAWDDEEGEYRYCISIRDGIAESSWGKEKPEWIVEQFTGLLDKHGKEIYENDVVLLDSTIYELCYAPGQIVAIEWDDDSTGFKPFMDGHSDYDGVGGNQCEIIGTIHDAEYKELAK